MQTITLDPHFITTNSQESSIVDQWLPRIQNNDEYLELGLTFAPQKNSIGDIGRRNDSEGIAPEMTNFRPLGDLGAMRLANALQCNTRLLALNISGNKIGGMGVAALAKALYRDVGIDNQEYESRTALQLLDLSNNQIGDEGATALGEALRHNTSLRNLDLSFNEISSKGVVELLTRALIANSSLKRLSLIGNLNILSGDQMSELFQSMSYVLHRGNSRLEAIEIHSDRNHETYTRDSKYNDSFFGAAKDEDVWKLLLAICGTLAPGYSGETYSGLHKKHRVKHHRLRTLTVPDSKETIPTDTKGLRSQLDRVLHFNAFYHPIVELHDLFDLQQPCTKYVDSTLPYHLQRDVHSGALIGLLPSLLINNMTNNGAGSSRDNFKIGVAYVAMPQVLSFAARYCELNTLWNVMRYRPDIFRYAGRGFRGKQDIVVGCDACGMGGCLLS